MAERMPSVPPLAAPHVYQETSLASRRSLLRGFAGTRRDMYGREPRRESTRKNMAGARPAV